MPDYFTLAELRALPDMDNAVKYPDARVEVEAAFVARRIREVVGTSFVPVAVVETHSGGDTGVILDARVVEVTSATEDGAAVTDDLRVVDGVLRRFAAGSSLPTRWAAGVGNVSVTYQAGYSTTPPEDIKSVALQWTRLRLLTTSSGAGNDARATSQTTDRGTLQFVVAGEDQPSGYPEIDATLITWRDRLDVHGFA